MRQAQIEDNGIVLFFSPHRVAVGAVIRMFQGKPRPRQSVDEASGYFGIVFDKQDTNGESSFSCWAYNTGDLKRR